MPGRGGRGAPGKLAKARVTKACREGSEDLKDSRFLYLSIDEAGTHVGKRHFRLLVRDLTLRRFVHLSSGSWAFWPANWIATIKRTVPP